MFILFHSVFQKFIRKHDLVVVNANIQVSELQSYTRGSLLKMDDLEMSNIMLGVNANSDANS